MRLTEHQDYRDRITDEAAAWFVRLRDPESGPTEQGAFADWLAASAENVREYLLIASLSGDVAGLSSQPSAEELIRRARPENVVALDLSRSVEAPVASEPSARSLGTRLKSRWLTSSLAAMLLIATLTLVGRSDVGTVVYRTTTGQQSSFPLPDGSMVILNAVSELHVHYTLHGRDVQLVSGEALFNVAKDRNRPFRVHSGDAVIQAIGTRFNVYHRAAGTRVTVVEGEIEVRPVVESRWPAATTASSPAGVKPAAVRLVRGKAARVEAGSGTIVVSDADLKQVAAWRERRLIFEARPLRDAVAEFNLYNDTALHIHDPALEGIEVSGAFYANDPESFALFLHEAGLATLVRGRAGAMELRVARAAKK
jgi:transmembrane sensor